MDKFLGLHTDGTKLHHAYFFVGNVEEVSDKLLGFFENKFRIKIKGNPDFKYLKFETLSIGDAREITEASQRKSFDREKMIFVLVFEAITTEAQNSFLKVLEEPTKDTHFFLVSSHDSLLPTLRSRLQVIKCESMKVGEEGVSRTVLNTSLKERLERVKALVESISDEEGTKQDAFDLINQFELEIYNKGAEKYKKELEVCQKTRESLLQRGAPVKMILENLVLSI